MKLTITESRVRELYHNIVHIENKFVCLPCDHRYRNNLQKLQLVKIGNAIVRVTKYIVFRHDEANVYETVFPQGINSASKS
ncbi:hypothetical protein V1478_000283 [Vespula squamosa]|uniref:Uncharacterized protein n=1 Tax=Vespula squamosa TaxID=30214 RepID=A0ABD2C522_VESSQ